ncbi:hypothetical protein RhiirA5_418567 [Rhizophagus irregularis]|uniref:Uncharacterized protein n=1 Tax=Rhizophagus irregularis TaxID=588596 RepID=A0A2N0PK28_9GLOM|nr:hypothetical protein RhiirA5_418567 [Rhizophagus irregularis]PKK74015.1 hypothetical protein RhiirC2_775346 [Rhizophagus irregularis]CAB4396539.1 unnamed protein product [Rhizophagus irregularis]CAB4493711.1 unnamed protein product [Rhizophagus irregularis]CAB5216097.1 unnamed protein product [Rhizophagus irregularis]
MNNFTNQIDYNNLCSFLNINEQVQKLANKVRDGTISQMLTGKELLKLCLENKLRSDNQRDIIDLDSTTNEIWNSKLTISQKKLLTRFADNVNKNRNSNTIELIARINMPQITNSEFENLFFNGTSFHDDKSLESSILPLGVVYRGSFDSFQ